MRRTGLGLGFEPFLQFSVLFVCFLLHFCLRTSQVRSYCPWTVLCLSMGWSFNYDRAVSCITFVLQKTFYNTPLIISCARLVEAVCLSGYFECNKKCAFIYYFFLYLTS